MEDFDSRETLLMAFEEVLSNEEFRSAPSVGVVLQAYLRDADETLDRILSSPALTDREVPPTIRLVKGAYWDHESVIAGQRGWQAPVWSEKHESDACFERLTRRLVDARDSVRPAIATHNLRSLAHAIAYHERSGGEPRELELQVLRGLGDELAEGVATDGLPGPHLHAHRRPCRGHGVSRPSTPGELVERGVPAPPAPPVAG